MLNLKIRPGDFEPQLELGTSPGIEGSWLGYFGRSHTRGAIAGLMEVGVVGDSLRHQGRVLNKAVFVSCLRRGSVRSYAWRRLLGGFSVLASSTPLSVLVGCRCDVFQSSVSGDVWRVDETLLLQTGSQGDG